MYPISTIQRMMPMMVWKFNAVSESSGVELLRFWFITHAEGIVSLLWQIEPPIKVDLQVGITVLHCLVGDVFGWTKCPGINVIQQLCLLQFGPEIYIQVTNGVGF